MLIVHNLPVNYSYQSLEPYISREIMKIHYEKHHLSYIKNVNNALAHFPLLELKIENIEELINNLHCLPSSIKTIVRNNLGGHLNHMLFWKIMDHDSKNMHYSEIFLNKIQEDFESYENFIYEFKKLANSFFGSGWIWLSVNLITNKLVLDSYLNQDTPYFYNLHPILGIDLWEHAYYLQYENRRTEYIDAWLNVINKNFVSYLYETIINS